jgi:hypothetical protein
MKLKTVIQSFFFVAIMSMFSLTSFAQANPDNPYDNAGKKHNEMLDIIIDGIDNGTLPNNNKSIPDLLDGIIPVCFPLFEDFFNFDDYSTFFKETNEEIINTSQIDSKQYYNNLLEEGTISGDLHNKLIKLNAIVSSNNSYEKIISMVKDLEAETKGILNETEIPVFYSASSVARYSTFYWNTEGNELQILAKNSPGNNIVNSDVDGAVKGATAAIGAVYIGGVSLTPVGFGSIVGGVATVSSAGQALKELAGWLFG